MKNELKACANEQRAPITMMKRGNSRADSGLQSFGHFDPADLLGTQVPFVDPFSYDDRDFRCVGFGRHSANLAARPFEEPCGTQASKLDEHMLGRAPSLPTPLPEPLPEPAAAAVTDERIKLNPNKAIQIFNLKRTKTASTASMLAIQYNTSAKAIRDIWTQKSWAQHTRPYWSD